MSSSTLYTVLLMTLLLLLILVVVVLFVLSRSRKSGKDAAEAEKPEAAEAPANAAVTSAGELGASFRQALRLLRERTGDPDARYALPWYLLMGDSGAGKTSLLAESSLAPEITDQLTVERGAALAWNFLPEGVVLDVRGDWSFGGGSNAGGTWRRLLALLRRYRAERPLDGVILAVSAKDLAGPTAMEPTALIERATYLQQRLRQIQSDCGLRLPVYLVLTHCDSIGGFRELAHALTPAQRDEIFGWSNPFSSELQFRGEWTDSALASMRHAVEYRVNGVFATEAYRRTHDALALLPANLQALQPRLKVLLSRALRSTGNVPEPFFRGVYCTGMLTDDLFAAQPPANRARPFDSVPRASFAAAEHGRTDHRFDWGSLALADAPLAPERWSSPLPSARVVFARDLLLRRIFRERALAVPLANAFQQRGRTRRILQGVAIGLATLLAVGMVFGYNSMSTTRDRLLPLLTNVANDMRMRTPAAAMPDDVALQTPTDDLIRVTLQTGEHGVHSVFYPTSWGRPLDADLQKAIAPAFRVLVLERFERQLELKAQQITSADLLAPGSPDMVVRPEDSTTPSRTASALQDLPSFRIQQHFVEAALELQRHIGLYGQLSTPGSGAGLQQVVELDAYLNNRPEVTLPTDATSPAFEEAIARAPWQPFRYSPVDVRNASQRFTDMNTLLFADTIEQNPIRIAAESVVVALRRIGGRATPAYEDVRAAQRAFTNLNIALRRPELAWVGGDELRMPQELAAITLDPIGHTPYLPATLRSTIQETAQDSFRRLTAALDNMSTPQSGPLLTANSGRLQLTDRAQEVQLGLENLMSLAFVTPHADTVATVQDYGAAADWNKAALQDALKLPDSLRRYMTESLQQAPAPLQTSLGHIARERLGTAMETAVAQAEAPGPRLPANAKLDTEIQPAVQRFAAVAPTLRDVMESMRSNGLNTQYVHLRAVTDEQALGLLNAVDRAFNAESPYTISPASLEHWNGSADPTVALLGVATGEELPAYLAAQRERVRAYSAAADPLVQFLQANGDNGRLPRRWGEITAELKLFDSKRPGNSVNVLESYIAADLPKLRIDQACVQTRAFPRGADYFQQVALQLGSEVRARCEALRGSGEASAYDAVATRFNGGLAGRFPFADISSSQAVEADTAGIGQFYALFDIYTALRRTGAGGRERNFADDLLQARPFFLAVNSKPSATIDFVPHFRVARDRETGANQIAEWTLQVGNDSYRSGDPERRGSWSVGQPVTLTLRWAQNAAFVPADAAGNGMRADARGVTYRFTDAWSLLRLATVLAVPLHDPAYAGDPNLLLVRIPERGVKPLAGMQTTAIAEARVFLRLDLLASGKTDAVAMPVLPLPSSAPVTAAAARARPAGTGYKGDAR